MGTTSALYGKFIEEISKQISELERESAAIKIEIKRLRKARSAYQGAGGRNGSGSEVENVEKEIIDTIIALLRDHGGERRELTTVKLVKLVLDRREFLGDRPAEGRIRTSIKLGIRAGKIIMIDDDGNPRVNKDGKPIEGFAKKEALSGSIRSTTLESDV